MVLSLSKHFGVPLVVTEYRDRLEWLTHAVYTAGVGLAVATPVMNAPLPTSANAPAMTARRSQCFIFPPYLLCPRTHAAPTRQTLSVVVRSLGRSATARKVIGSTSSSTPSTTPRP